MIAAFAIAFAGGAILAHYPLVGVGLIVASIFMASGA